MRARVLVAVLLALAVALLALASGVAGQPGSGVSARADIEVFSMDGCPYCAAAGVFLADLARARPDLRVVVHDVGRDAEALERLRALAAARGVTAVGVPAFLVRGELTIGFQGPGTTGAALLALLEPPAPTAAPAGDPDAVEVPLLGRVSARDLGLTLFTVVLGLLDGFNPCAMWVLLFVLSLLVNLRDRRRMALIGGTFVVVSGLVYFAFMAAWLNVFLLVGISRATQMALGGIAVFVGVLNVKDSVALGRGPSLGIPAAARPGIYARVRRVIQAEQLTGALASVAVLAFLVNVIELLCTAGFPAVYTRILTLRTLPAWEYYAYLALYNAAYMLDDAIMLGIAVVTLGRRKLQERGGQWLKLVSGLVMLGLGLTLLLRPGWLAGPGPGR